MLPPRVGLLNFPPRPRPPGAILVTSFQYSALWGGVWAIAQAEIRTRDLQSKNQVRGEVIYLRKVVLREVPSA